MLRYVLINLFVRLHESLCPGKGLQWIQSLSQGHEAGIHQGCDTSPFTGHHAHTRLILNAITMHVLIHTQLYKMHRLATYQWTIKKKTHSIIVILMSHNVMVLRLWWRRKLITVRLLSNWHFCQPIHHKIHWQALVCCGKLWVDFLFFFIGKTWALYNNRSTITWKKNSCVDTEI